MGWSKIAEEIIKATIDLGKQNYKEIFAAIALGFTFIFGSLLRGEPTFFSVSMLVIIALFICTSSFFIIKATNKRKPSYAFSGVWKETYSFTQRGATQHYTAITVFFSDRVRDRDFIGYSFTNDTDEHLSYYEGVCIVNPKNMKEVSFAYRARYRNDDQFFPGYGTYNFFDNPADHGALLSGTCVLVELDNKKIVHRADPDYRCIRLDKSNIKSIIKKNYPETEEDFKFLYVALK